MFLALVTAGGAVVVFMLFLLGTLMTVSRGYLPELKREGANQRSIVFPNGYKITNFSLKDYRTRLRQKFFHHTLQLGNSSQEHPQLQHIEDPPQSRRPKAIDLFLSNHHAVPMQDEAGLSAAVKLATRFPFQSDFSFPQPNVMRTLDDISRASWVTDLRYYLSTYNYSREISLVTSNSKYTDVLLNWLISATVKSGIPVKSILIISLDKTIHRLLLAKQFCSIFIPPRSLLDASANFSQPFEHIMMARLAIMRIVNHFGYDFVMYDSDAVILKDPQPLYDTLPYEDIIGSVGKIPYDLAAEWGITICIGVVLVRSSPKTGECFQIVSSSLLVLISQC